MQRVGKCRQFSVKTGHIAATFHLRQWSVRPAFAVVAAFVLVAMISGQARAAVNYSDSFSYPAGSNISGQNGGTGFATPWTVTGTNVDTINSNLTYPGVNSSGGSLSSSSSSASAPGRSLSAVYGTANTVQWLSFLIREDQPSTDPNQYGGIVFGTLFVGGGAGGGLNTTWGMNTAGNNPGTLSTVPVVQGQTTFLVMRLAFAAGNTNIQLFVDPSTSTTPTTADATKTNLDLTYNAIAYEYRDSNWTIDEIRAGDTFADVVPEPGTLSLATIGASLFLLSRRSRAKNKEGNRSR